MPASDLKSRAEALYNELSDIGVLVSQAYDTALDETRCGAETYEIPTHFGNVIFTLNRIARDKIDALRDDLAAIIGLEGGAR